MTNTSIQKPSGYWKNRDNVVAELKRLESVLGHFPTQTELYAHDLSGLSMAIHRHHGGIRALRESMGDPLEFKEAGYWKDLANVTQEIEALAAKLGHYPSRAEMNENRTGLTFAIKTYFGGFIAFRKMMHANHFWDDAASVIHAISELETSLGYFPTIEEIAKHGPTGLYPAIIRHYGGIREFRKELDKPLHYPSSLECRVKLLLNRWVDDPHYVDGAKKSLQKYGLNLQHPGSKNYLELDRYYFNAKVAIEVQGQQHFYTAKLFAKHGDKHATLKKRLEFDETKRKLLAENNVKLIELKYSDSDELILKKLTGVLPLRPEPLAITESDMRTINQGIDRYPTKEIMTKAGDLPCLPIPNRYLYRVDILDEWSRQNLKLDNELLN